MSSRRLAAIDCGTNSIRLLVADVDSHARTLVDLDRRMTIVRLGEGVDRTGQFSEEALTRTFAACDEYASVIASLGVDAVRFVATSASRDASNREVFIAGVQERFGVQPEVVPGTEEAALSFTGAVRGLGDASGPAPFLVVDIGGGSTEFVRGSGGSEAPEAAVSVDVGCVRMTERHLRHDPPLAAEVSAATADIESALDLAADEVDLSGCTVVGVAGSVTTVAAIHLGLSEYDSALIHGSRIPAEAALDISSRLLLMTRVERSQMPVMHPGRVDVIGAGALVLARIVQRTGVADVVVSETDILDGICWSMS